MKISIGPAIEDGFYYDFEFPEGVTVTDADFPAIEAAMKRHIKAAETFDREDVDPATARERFLAEGQDYKVELIDDLVAGRCMAMRRRRRPSTRSRSTPTGRSPTSAVARTCRTPSGSARSSS